MVNTIVICTTTDSPVFIYSRSRAMYTYYKYGAEVVLQLISTKCMPILLYGLEAFSLYNYQLKSLDFVINRFFMKLFRTSNIHVVSDCQEQFNFVLPSVQLARRAKKFANKLNVN